MSIVKRLQRPMALMLVTAMFLPACSLPEKHEDVHHHFVDREPAGEKKNKKKKKDDHAFHSHNSFLDDAREINKKDLMYKYKGILKFPPARWIAGLVVKTGLNMYLNNLPLEDDVKARFKDGMKSDQFAGIVVPFLMAMQQAYLANGKERKLNFANYIKKEFPDKNSIPGLEHSHFHYKKEKKKEEKLTKEEEKKKDETTKKMIAGIVTAFDVIFLRDNTFKLGQPPVRDLVKVEGLKVEVKKIIEILRDGAEGDPIMFPIYDNLSKDDDRIEAMSVSLIDFAGIFTFNHYQMFAKRYQYENDMQAKLQAQFDNELGDELWDNLENDIYRKRYGVQVIVDGLQGRMVEAFAKGDHKHPYIQKIAQEFEERAKNKPKNIPFHETHDQEVKFLRAVAKGEVNLKEISYLNFFRELYAKYEKGVVKTGISTSPTISIRNLPMIQTGASVNTKGGGTGLPNFHYLDRKKEQAYYFWGNDALMLDELTSKAGMKNLFQRMPDKFSLNCMATYETGSNWSISPLLNVALGERLKDFGEILCMSELEDRADVEKKIRKVKLKLLKLGMKIRERKFKGKDDRKVHIKKAQKLIDEIAEFGSDGMPELLVFYSPWVDHNGHFTGPFGDETISPTGELNRLDYWLGRLTKTYKDAEIYDRTMFTMAGDHGLTPTKYLIKAEKQIFEGMQKDGVEIKTWKISSDEGEGPKIRNHLKKENVHGYDVMTASTGGGNFQIELFVDQDDNWARQPVYKEAINLKLQSGQVVDIPKEIVTRLEDTLEYGAIRETESNLESSVTRIFAQRNGQRVDELIHRKGEKVFYQASEANLLETNKISQYDYKPEAEEMALYRELYRKCMKEATLEDETSWCNEKDWRTLTSFTNKPDSVVQISHLFDIDISGTIHLFSQPYIGFNSIVPGRHAGELFHEKDAFLAIWGTPVKIKKKMRSRTILSSAPALYEWLSGKEAVKGEDGWGESSLLKQPED